MNKYVVVSVLAGLMCLVANTGVAQPTGYVKILRLGCHVTDDTCYVLLDLDSPLGPESCPGKSFRWSANSVNGQAVLSQLTAAFFADKTVSLNASGCHQNQYPSFSYYNIQ